MTDVAILVERMRKGSYSRTLAHALLDLVVQWPLERVNEARPAIRHERRRRREEDIESPP